MLRFSPHVSVALTGFVFTKGDTVMTKTIGLWMLAVVVACGVGRSGSVRAEVGPLSMDQLNNEATLIAIGHVTRILERDETDGEFVVAHFTVRMNLMKVEKGSLPPESSELEFTGVRTLRKPPGFVGRLVTLREDLNVGDSVRVFLEREADHWQIWHRGCVQKSPEFGS